MADRPSKRTRGESRSITFTEEEANEVSQPHDDPLVISAILVDSGSSADILYWGAFEKMKIGRDKLKPVCSPLVGFTGDRVVPLGSITLPVTLGDGGHQATKMVTFLVVDCPSAYNVILGRTALNEFRAITSTYHLLVKFPTEEGVGYVKGDQKVARECYVSSLKEETPKEALVIDGLEVRDEEEIKRGEPEGEMEDLMIGSPEEGRTIKVGSETPEPLKTEIKNFLKNNLDVFAWSHEDMPGINTSVITHHLNILPDARPIKQKRRNFCQDRNEAIAEEVDKLIKAKFIREVHYPTWLSNVVMVKKSNGKWRMCVDFTDLNKACPKDSFPLPSIDLLVDSTAGHEMLTFMDAFSGYNQIKMAEHDQEHTAFITDRGLYCYNVMPFGLKNAGATYQRLMNRMFGGQVGRNMEVYVDDMLVKSKKADSHVADLQETFNTLRKYGMKLNPAKCAFGVASGKFLGFMVSSRGIEANPEKIRAIIEMQPPRSTKEVQKLAGRVAALNRFISRSTDKCYPFFKVLRKAFEWTLECEQAFQQLKEYLGAVPLLSRTTPGEELLLYLAVSSTAVSSALVREEDGVQKPVYYTSKALRGAEERYPKMELLALALVTAARRLRERIFKLTQLLSSLTNL